MSLYECTQCHVVENTALGGYWARKMDGKPVLCSQCDPEIGKWHGEFQRRTVEEAGLETVTSGPFKGTLRAAAPAVQCEIACCIGGPNAKGEIRVNEVIDDGSYLTYICRACADAIGVTEGDDLPEPMEVKNRLEHPTCIHGDGEETERTAMTDRNMYGVTPCPRCGSEFRWPTQQGQTQCDDCGYVVAHLVRDGGYTFDDRQGKDDD